MADREYVERRLEELLREERAASGHFHQVVKQATKAYEDRRQRLDAKRASIERRSDEPVVIVRKGPGPAPTVFHRTDKDCGWKPSAGEHLFLSEALDRGLQGCSSCASYRITVSSQA
jgi:hypothetical protein